MFSQTIDIISRARNVSVPTLRGIIDRAPLTAEEAVDCGLLDGALYREGVYAAVQDLVKSSRKTVRRLLPRHPKATMPARCSISELSSAR